MSRLCERPGCSDVAAVAYGMRTEDLVFWLDVLEEEAGAASGVLCRRHGDSMVVPRGWTLDDLRDPDLHLFRPPAAIDARRPPRSPRKRSTPGDDTEQLALGGVAPPEPRPDDIVDAEQEPERGSDAGGWRPGLAADDDLDGLLAARSPLLSRAFRGVGRGD